MSRRPSLYNRIRMILESARSGVLRTVNTTQVIANWLVGREIVEEEQHGKRRASYGKKRSKRFQKNCKPHSVKDTRCRIFSICGNFT